MKRFLLVFCMFAVATAAGIRGINAQSPAGAAMPSGRILELELRSGGLPAEISLPSQGTRAGFWTSNIDRTKKDPAGPAQRHPIVDFSARLVEGKAELKISILSGTRFRESEELIATYTLGEGESVVASEMAKFGYVPATIRMRAVDAAIASVPIVSNKSRSLVVTIEPTVATRPAFIVKMANGSQKNVMGVAWSTSRGGKPHLSMMQRNLDGRPLIRPGETLDRSIPLERLAPGEDAGSFNIETVLFDDGSFEGRVESAAQFRVYWHSEKAVLAKLAPVLRKAASSQSPTDIPMLIGALELEGRGVPRSAVDAMLAEFPEHKQLHKTFEGWFGSTGGTVIHQLVTALRNLQKETAGRSDADLTAGLTAISRQADEWLGRISK